MVPGIEVLAIYIRRECNMNFYQNYQYWYSYNLTRIKRVLMLTIMIFSIQYLVIINVSSLAPALPMYPPIGIAFTMFYLFGNNAVYGLLLSGFCAYIIKGLGIEAMLLFLIADIGGGYIGAHWCQNVFSSDIKPFANLQENWHFFKINAFVTCIISSLLRWGVTIWLPTHNLSVYAYIDLWLADLNAILVLSGFLLSWAYVPLSREKICEKIITKASIMVLVLFIIASILFMQKFILIYFIVAAMLISLYCAYTYGYLVAMVLLFIISSIFLGYFIAHKQQYLDYFGLGLYTIAPISLLVYVVCMLYVGHFQVSNLRKRLKMD